MLHPVPFRNCFFIALIISSVIANVACGGGAAGANIGGTGGAQTNPASQTTTALSVSPGTVEFSDQALSTLSSPQSVIVSNAGTASVSIGAIAVTGNFLEQHDCGTTLAPSRSCTVAVTFSPETAGTLTGELKIVDSSTTKQYTIAVRGRGVSKAQLKANVSSLDFGSVTVGQSTERTVTLSNTGGQSLTISGVSTSLSSFSVSGLTLPLTLPAGATATLNVSFSPTSVGGLSGSLSIANSASNQPYVISLTGTGLAQSKGQLAVSTTSLNFGTTITGQSSSQTLRLSNTGTATLTVNGITTNGSGFSATGTVTPFTIAPGASSDVVATFKPSVVGSATGSITVANSTTTQPITITLSGTAVAPAQLTASASSLNFGTVTVGQSSSLSLRLTNTGGAALTVSGIAVTGTGFVSNSPSMPLTLAPGAVADITATFNPSTSGSASGSLTVTNSASQPLSIALSGTGATAGQLVTNTTNISFGTVTVGQSGAQSVTLTNTGGSTLTVSSISTSGPGFALSGITVPLTMTPGTSKSFSVTFSPSNAGDAAGTVYVASSTTGQALTINLAGTAVNPPAPVTHSVTLSWNACTSTVAGYYIYRGTQNGGPYTKLNASVETGTVYTDETVQNGKVYYYVLTALDQKAVESNYSSQVVANVPAN